MTDEATDEERPGAAVGPDAPTEGAADADGPAGQAGQPANRGAVPSGGHPRRSAVVAGGVAVVVAVAAVVGYLLVIPMHQVDRGRLARLVVTRPGVKEFDTKPARAAELPVSGTGLSVLQGAAQKAPDASGSYLVAWAGAGANNALETVAFLTPSPAVAKRLQAQIASTNLSAQALSSSSLNRLSTFTVPGVPGTAGSLFGPSSPAAGPSQLAITAFQDGRVVTVTEALHPTSAQPDSETATVTEYRHLQTVEPGFSLKVVHWPLTATIVWVAGAVVAVVLIATSPVTAGRIRRRRRERREAEERARGSVVPGHRITKRQR